MTEKFYLTKLPFNPVYPKPINVLIVDNYRKSARLLKGYLQHTGYNVHTASLGLLALQMVQDHPYHVVILEVMLPDMDGFDVLKRLRQATDIPILLFTAQSEEMDRIVGLELGADDYLPKTVSIRELLARLRAVIRRRYNALKSTGPRYTADNLTLGDLIIDRPARKAMLGERLLELTALEFDLLVYLAKHAGTVLTRDQLLDAVTGRSYNSIDRSIDVHISSLRRKMGDAPRNAKRIITIRSVGYMFKINGDQRRVSMIRASTRSDVRPSLPSQEIPIPPHNVPSQKGSPELESAVRGIQRGDDDPSRF